MCNPVTHVEEICSGTHSSLAVRDLCDGDKGRVYLRPFLPSFFLLSWPANKHWFRFFVFRWRQVITLLCLRAEARLRTVRTCCKRVGGLGELAFLLDSLLSLGHKQRTLPPLSSFYFDLFCPLLRPTLLFHHACMCLCVRVHVHTCVYGSQWFLLLFVRVRSRTSSTNRWIHSGFQQYFYV